MGLLLLVMPLIVLALSASKADDDYYSALYRVRRY